MSDTEDHQRLRQSTAEDANQKGGTAQRRSGGKRQPLSCLSCRNHKLRCDRRVPCSSCVRYHRENHCRQNPAPTPPHPRTRKRARPSLSNPSRPTATEVSPVLPGPADDIVHHGPGREDAGQMLRGSGSDPGQRIEDSSHVAGASSFRQGNETEQLPIPSSVSDGLSLLAAFDMESSPWPSLRQLLAEAARGEEPSSVWHTMIDPQFRQKLAQQQLSSVLPSRPQCDLLLNFFLEHINWLFQTVHEPSFRREYARFWDEGMPRADFIWTSLLFTILSVSALHVPLEAMDVVGFPRQAIRNLAHIWHLASSHALRAGEYESKPCLVQLQTFSITQLYWYATNQVEVLNSRLGQSVKTAQAIRLDRDTSPSESLKDEMRHRIWWDLVDSDMFQTICLDRPPLIRLSSPGVPLPLNCNDSDLTDNSVQPRPIEEPTVMSMNIFRARAFQLLNQDFFQREVALDNDRGYGGDNDDPRRWHWNRGSDYEDVVALDRQILNLMASFPWYFQLDADGRPPRLAEPLGERITWQHHILRTCISTQRIRMYRQYLHPRTGEAWQSCISAAKDSMIVYRWLRSQTAQTSRQKFLPQAYQIFSVAVTVVALLLVEGSLPIPNVYQQVRDMTKDLGILERQGCRVPIATHGRRVLRKMLDLCEARATARSSTSPEEVQILVPDIAIILGGEHNTRAYIDQLRNQPASEAVAAGGTNEAPSLETDMVTWDGEATGPPAIGNHETERERGVDWDQVNGVSFGPGLVSPESSHLTSGLASEPIPGDMDPELFVQDTRLMGLLNWDMTGLFMLDPSDE